jgi:hypothetical protein
MKAFLMYRDRDFDLEQTLPLHTATLIQDLELNTLFNAMAAGDKFLFAVANKAVLSSLVQPEAILYRQDVLRDCNKNATVARQLYDLAVEAIENEKKHYWGFSSRYPSSILHGTVDALQRLVGMLKRLRSIADDNADKFSSEAFVTLFTMLKKELGDDYFAELRTHLRQLKFNGGVLLSAELGKGGRSKSYTLRQPHDPDPSWFKRVVTEIEQVIAEKVFSEPPPAYTFVLHPRDEAGAQALSTLRDRGINLVANALAQSTDHIVSFFTMLRTELAFYVGCLNLHQRLADKSEPLCFPIPVAATERRHSFRELYDICLALTVDGRIIGNEINADGKDLTVVTGANQGGKSTFLRSIGLSQLMMQAGMFVPAESFSANVCVALFTHYKREEDTAMESGKFDEELSRMSAIIEELTPDATVLFNESFAATNEREGSEIGRQIVRALLEKRIKVFFVTHFYDFANSFWERHLDNVIFLRAERRADGIRTFKLIEGEPLKTSFGEDLYRRIFDLETVH